MDMKDFLKQASEYYPEMKEKKTALDYSIPSNDETIVAEPDVIENEEPNLDETSVDINEVLNDNPQDVTTQDAQPTIQQSQETAQPEKQPEKQAEEAIKEKIIEAATDGNPATKIASHVAQALNEKVGDDLWSQIIKDI